MYVIDFPIIFYMFPNGNAHAMNRLKCSAYVVATPPNDHPGPLQPPPWPPSCRTFYLHIVVSTLQIVKYFSGPISPLLFGRCCCIGTCSRC